MEPNQRPERLRGRETYRSDSPDRARHRWLHRVGQPGTHDSNASRPPNIDTGTPTPTTDVMITYTLPTCPPGARCVQASTTQKYYIVSRQLTCSPAGGNYADAAAACQALSDVVTKLGTKNWVCGCAPVGAGHIPAKAVGYYHGKRRTIPLDACSLCNLPGVGADIALLLPGIHG